MTRKRQTSIIIQINSSRTESGGALVLFDSRLGPATKGRKVSKGGPVVVVRVPEWVGGELARSTADWVPLAGGGVDAEVNSLTQPFVHHALDEVHVVLCRRGPILSSLHIDPEHADSGSESAIVVGLEGLLVLAVVTKDLEAMRFERVQGVVHLLSRVATRVAGEDVAIHVAHPSRPGIIDAVRTCKK
jgi:hypothetical protein